MLELVLIVCLIAEPLKCKEVKLQFAEMSITPYSCAMSGQIEIAKYLQNHPDLAVKSWKCGRPTKNI